MTDFNPVDTKGEPISNGYCNYALFVLVIVYVFNFVDRQILSILAEDIKADLGVSDAQIGFLYGTAFAVFYAVFGLPLARLADAWVRTRLISIGLGFWSIMTAASGFAQNFFSLALCRFGVGVGEASASPAANSLLADYFPPKLRATVIAIYSSGIYLGAGLGVFLGGVVVSTWNAWYPDTVVAPLSLAGWQVAFLVVGLPGILAAFWVSRMREPQREEGSVEVSADAVNPLRLAFEELLTVLPPLTLIGLLRAGGKRSDFLWNGLAATVLFLVAYTLIALTGNAVQWVAVALGFYGAFSWAQCLSKREASTFAVIFRSPTVLLVIVGFSLMSFVSYGIGFWFPSFLIREHGVDAAQVGMIYGACVVTGGMLGVTSAGIMADRLYQRLKYGRLIVGLVSMLVCVPVVMVGVNSDALVVVYAGAFGFCLTSPMWMGICFSTLVDIVSPQIRATVVALSILANTFVGLAIGPFVIGQISDWQVSLGVEAGAALGSAMQLGLLAALLGAVLIGCACRTINSKA